MKKTVFLAGSLLLYLTIVPVVSAETLMDHSVVKLVPQKEDDSTQKDDCEIDKDCIDTGYIQQCCEPLWTFRAGVLVLKRESPIKEVGPISYKVFDFDYEGGVDVGAIRRFGENHALEFRYFGIDEWSDDLSFGPLGASYASSLHSTELNLRRQLGERVDVLAGFRWVELHEELNTSIGQLPLLSTNVDNHMYGFQIGGEALIWDRGGRFQVTSGAKAGIYYNDADATGSLFGLFSGGVEEAHTSFLGELDIVGRLALTDNLALRVGYEMMWIEGVAGAGGQLASAFTGNNVDTASSPFYHGAILGVELTR